MEKRNYFICYPILLTVLITVQLICFIFARRQIDFFNYPVNVSGMIFPLNLYLIEIIGECYGYEYSRQTVWLNVIAHILFILAVVIISGFQYPDFMHSDLTFSYQKLIDISWIVALGSLLGTFFGDLFSARYIPNLKVILHGKFIFLRLLLCQIVSEIIVTSSYLISFLTNNYTFAETIHLIYYTVIIKSIIAILLYPLARAVISIIKQIEKIEAFDFKQDYKTLAFIINQDKIALKGIDIRK